jgi:hypothetical protein
MDCDEICYYTSGTYSSAISNIIRRAEVDGVRCQHTFSHLQMVRSNTLRALIRVLSAGKCVHYAYMVRFSIRLFASEDLSKYVRMILATNDIVGQTQFSLEVMQRAVPMYEEVFDVEYPLVKLDTLVAHDFDIGAMENWVNSSPLTSYTHSRQAADLLIILRRD